MSLAAGRSQLSNAFKALKQEWEATENVWRDIIRKEFAEKQWDPMAARLSSVLTAAVRAVARSHGALDVPNERSSHRVATPRGGGIAVVVVTTAVFAGVAAVVGVGVDVVATPQALADIPAEYLALFRSAGPAGPGR